MGADRNFWGEGFATIWCSLWGSSCKIKTVVVYIGHSLYELYDYVGWASYGSIIM